MTESRIRLPRVLKGVTFGDASRPLDVANGTSPTAAPSAADEGSNRGARVGTGAAVVRPRAETPARDDTAERSAQEAAWRKLIAAFGGIDEQLREIEHRRQQSLVEMQQAAVELAVAIASRIVHETIEADELAMEKIVSELLAQVAVDPTAKLRLHPADLELIERRSAGRDAPWHGAASIQVLADPRLQRGECRLETAEFDLLSQIELQLNEIRQHLLETLHHAQVERRRPQAGGRSLRRFPDRRETA